MATREASQKHAVLLELQHVLVAVKAAEYLSNGRQYRDHGFRSFTRHNVEARHLEHPLLPRLLNHSRRRGFSGNYWTLVTTSRILP